MRFGLWVAMALAWAWPGLAQAAWHEASSDHFVIYADDSVKDITRFSEQLERYHAGMAWVMARTASHPGMAQDMAAPVPSPSNRVTVYVVRNEREVRALHGGDNRYLGGFYVPRAGGSLAIVPTVQQVGGDGNWSKVILLHEYAHHFLISSTSMAMPRWYSEGSAEFFASAKFEDDGSLWLGRPAQHRAGELLYGKDVKAADLLDPTEYDKRKPGSYDAFYGKSWLLYHYLFLDEGRRSQLGRYLALLKVGKSQREAGLEAFGDFAALERDLDKYLARRRQSALHLKPEMITIGAVKVRALSAGEGEIMPVRIRSRRGVSREEAKPLLAEARAISAKYPADAAVLAALAECEHDAGNEKEAIAAADAAIKADPSQVNAYVQKGLALFRIAEEADDKAAAYKAARAPFIALNRLENDHPLPLIFFYRSFVQQGQRPNDLAIRGLIRATELAPFDLGLRMTLGNALVRLGRPDDARVILAPVAYNPHGGGMSEHARKMLERLDKDANWKGEDMASGDVEEESAKD